jgi:hypothetical protein
MRLTSCSPNTYNSRRTVFPINHCHLQMVFQTKLDVFSKFTLGVAARNILYFYTYSLSLQNVGRVRKCHTESWYPEISQRQDLVVRRDVKNIPPCSGNSGTGLEVQGMLIWSNGLWKWSSFSPNWVELSCGTLHCLGSTMAIVRFLCCYRWNLSNEKSLRLLFI